jgi:aryl-phospho-beta-D-glucosidase BglC (GH1 family)
VRRLRGIELIALITAVLLNTTGVWSSAGTAKRPEIHVRSNQLVDGAGKPVRLFGVNRSGTEYQCVVAGGTGAGIFNGPSDEQSIAAMSSWHVNAVRVSLNEDCWLGINGVNPAYSDIRYRNAIVDYVGRLNDAGMIAIVDLHWNAPGTLLSDRQQVMADADHAPAFWTSVASSFAGNPGVMFDLYNEPRDVSWSCWQLGCETADGWRTVGMQSLIDAVRRTGATQPIIATGLNHGNDLSGWLSHPLHDPLRQLVAGAHVYDTESDGYCHTVACWNRTLVPVAKKVPIVTGELGEHDRGSSFITTYMKWSDHQWRRHRGVSIMAWSWDAGQGEGGPSVIASYDGKPTTYGLGYRTYLEGLFERGQIHQW